MTTIRVAFYARVSSEQQAAAHTIESQVSALTERARSDSLSMMGSAGHFGSPSSGSAARSSRRWRYRFVCI
jgi:hypothetical protein